MINFSSKDSFTAHKLNSSSEHMYSSGTVHSTQTPVHEPNIPIRKHVFKTRVSSLYML